RTRLASITRHARSNLCGSKRKPGDKRVQWERGLVAAVHTSARACQTALLSEILPLFLLLLLLLLLLLVISSSSLSLFRTLIHPKLCPTNHII
ncbi:unnamed protein product, partial [Musa hybrid cultivar]